MTLLVEGGSQVNGSFLEEKAVDKFYLFFAPSWMGDRKAVGIFGGEGMRDLRETTGLEGVRVRRSGMDFLLEGYVAKGRDLCSQG
jgi:diaminohydroxyphosphoribosylaminopyrimidine deaminase/5-amino-6-(5-phosphoribosylamino)uracil reductase